MKQMLGVSNFAVTYFPVKQNFEEVYSYKKDLNQILDVWLDCGNVDMT